MVKSSRVRWSLCGGLVGSVLLAGLVTVSVTRSAGAEGVSAARAERGAQANLVATGQQRYNRACGRCHPGGGEDIGPAVRGINWDQARMTRQIRQGSGRMRAIPAARLPDADMPALMAYLRSIRAVR